MKASYVPPGADPALPLDPILAPATQSERLVAYFLDLVPLAILAYLLFLLTDGLLSSTTQGLAFLAIIWGYHAVLNFRPGQTFGKWVVGTQVLDLSGKSCRFTRSAGRSAAFFLSVLPFGLGLLSINFGKWRRALHDYLAGTYVATVRQKGPMARAVIAVSAIVLAILLGLKLIL